MSKLMVFLADIQGSIEWPAPIRDTLRTLFQKVITAGSDFTSVKIEYSSNPPVLGAHDLLVYFVESRSESVLRKGMSSSLTLGDTGTTGIGGTKVGSEVYLSGEQQNPVGLGKLAFHELMHNICLMKNGLHSVRGVSLGKEEVDAGTELNADDINLLVKHLKKKERVQWIDGYKFKPKKFKKGDPLGDPFS